MKSSLLYVALYAFTVSCSSSSINSDPKFSPSEVVDLGALATEDIPQCVEQKVYGTNGVYTTELK